MHLPGYVVAAPPVDGALPAPPYDGHVMAVVKHQVLTRVRRHLFESCTAAVWTVVGIAYLIDSTTAERSPIGQVVSPLDQAWSLMYVFGGPMVLFALLDNPPGANVRWRVAGLILLASGLAMQGFAAIAVQSPDVRAANYWIFCVACAARVVLVLRDARRDGGGHG